MLAKSHVVTSAAVTLPLLANSQQLTTLNLLAVLGGCLLPDIDHPSSYFGRRHKVVSSVTNKTLGHRGATHSLLAVVLVGIIFWVVAKAYLTAAAVHVPFWLMVGYTLHLLEDGFSKKGIRWFYPLQKHGFCLGGKLLFYRTGTISETIIFWIMVCLLVYEGQLLLDNQLATWINVKSIIINVQQLVQSTLQVLPQLK